MASKSNSDAQTLANVCELFHMMSDKTRLQIVVMLSEGERDVTSLCKALKLAQPTVSHHLGLLRMNRVIIDKRQGKRVIYTLNSATTKMAGSKLKMSSAPYNITFEGF